MTCQIFGLQSSVLGANKLWDTFGGKGKFVFHRGSKTVDRIENNFKRVKKLEGVSPMDLNKWSPADIYIVSDKFDPKCLDQEKTILGLNQCMQERIENNTLIGVSLKKIMGNARISLEKCFQRYENNQRNMRDILTVMFPWMVILT